MSLSENPTTGYQWMIIDQDLKVNNLYTVLKTVYESYVSSRPSGDYSLGQGGVKTISFKVIGEGEGKLNLYYARSWEIDPLIKSGGDIAQYISMVIPVKASDPK